MCVLAVQMRGDVRVLYGIAGKIFGIYCRQARDVLVLGF